ncbi:pilus assembly protein [Paraburkholderia fungorum]|uniref:Pilus assembly protein n=1 Tax=Paraburkholderia fungorum TaxID=134537 RepID=A0AAP5QAT4_9BURK|nr:TadE/TadG family type IV pilus assembly protein [Paraburkholderia fungorum]MDT8839814.1 pilus assembly protein [Paraburkholderia fungorum]
MVEFLIIAPVLLFLCFGTLQLVLLYQAKATLDVAVLEAAREGAVNHGSLAAMQSGLARGLAPLYAHQSTAQEVQAAKDKAMIDVTDSTHITTVSPTDAMMQDFGRLRSYPEEGAAYIEIPNDTLLYRDPNTGSRSKIGIQDANLLKIRVHYCYDMYVPLVNKVIYYATNVIGNIGTMGILTREPADQDRDPYGAPKNPDALCKVTLKQGSDSGHWPIALESEALVRMQSTYRRGAMNDAQQPYMPDQ